jgi:hypothetical protein
MGWLRSSISSIRMSLFSVESVAASHISPGSTRRRPFVPFSNRSRPYAVCNRGYSSFELFFVAYTRSCIAHICGIHSAISFPFNLPKIKGPAKGPNR